MQDPRMEEMLKRQNQVAERTAVRYIANKETAGDPRIQAITERENQVSGKRKDQRQQIDPELVAKRQALPQDPVVNILEKPQHSSERMRPHEVLAAGTKTSLDTPPSAGPPGTNKGLPSLHECSNQLKLRAHMICHMGNLYVYNGKCYDFLYPDDVIRLYRDRVDDQLGGEKSLRSIKQLHEYLLTDSSLQISEVESNQRIAVLRNGVFDVEAGKLRKHSDKAIVFSYINTYYVDHAKCKCFRRFLQCITHGDEVLQERLWQALGYLLLQTTEAKSFFVMGSAPDSGKSVLGNFIESLFDRRYVSNIALNDFNRNFALAPIVGSAINISLDLPATKLKPPAVSMLKMLTGGDTFTISQKYMPEFSYRNRAKLLFASNFPIGLYENDDAFWNRMVFLPFDYSIPKARQNSELLDMLQEERDAVVSEALRHAQTLIENNFCFPTTPSVERRMQEWQGHASPSIELFLRDCCLIDENCRGELTEDLFSAYQRYCDSSSLVAKSWSVFKQFLEREVGLDHWKMRGGGANPQSAFRGIKIKEANYD